MLPILGLLNPAMLVSFLPNLAGFVPAIFTSIQMYWKLYLVGLIVLLLTGSSFMWHRDADLLRTERTAHAADIKSYKTAQAEAEAKATQEKIKLAQQSKDNANAADKNYSTLLASYHANLLRYQAAKGIGSGPIGSQLASAPQGSDGPSTGAILSESIAISTDDANICSVNTARLQSAHDWALQLGKTPNDQKPK